MANFLQTLGDVFGSRSIVFDQQYAHGAKVTCPSFGAIAG
jgi:hypothetical protein